MHVTVNGVRLYVDIDGAGLVPDGAVMRERPTVILVHGGPGADHSLFKPAYAALGDVAQVVYYDHRGNGRSEGSDPACWTLAQWGDDLRGLCDMLGIERPVVIGTSFGGFVAQSYATRHPGHAGKLVLISTAARMEFDAVYAAFGRLGGPEVRAAAEAYWGNPTDESRARYARICLPYYQTTAMDPDWFGRVLMRNETALWFNGPRNEHGRMDFRPALGGVSCPVLLLAGEDDPITPPEFTEEIARHLPPGQVTKIRYAACGHGVIGDRPEEAMAAIRDFVCQP